MIFKKPVCKALYFISMAFHFFGLIRTLNALSLLQKELLSRSFACDIYLSQSCNSYQRVNMSRSKSHKHIPKKHKPARTKPGVVSYLLSGSYVCHLCEERHDQVPKEWDPWELPRHLEKAHGLPEEAQALRKKLIPNWNESFEKKYRENLEREIKYDILSEHVALDVDPLPDQFKEEEKQRRRKEQEAESDSY